MERVLLSVIIQPGETLGPGQQATTTTFSDTSSQWVMRALFVEVESGALAMTNANVGVTAVN